MDFALFVSFFPQLVAGPIERAQNLLPQIAAPRRVTRQLVVTGLNLMLIGYFKKVAIADTLAPRVETAFADPRGQSSGALLSGATPSPSRSTATSRATATSRGASRACWASS